MSKGFSLVEVLVAVAITSIVGAMVATLMSHMGNVASFYSTKEDYDSIYRATQLLLLNEQMCKYALHDSGGAVSHFDPTVGSAVNPVKTQLDAVFMASPTNPTTGTDLVKVGVKYSNRLQIQSIHLQEHSPNTGRGTVFIPDGAGNPISYKTFLVDLHIAATNLAGGPALAVKPVPLTIVVNSSNLIIDCFATSSSAALCAVLHAALDPVTGQCMIPECSATMASPPSCSPPNNPTDCTTPIYFLAFSTGGTPTCQCVRSCTGPAGPAGATGAAGAPGATVPIFTY